MPRFKKIGAPLFKYNGKTLYEILANLKNFGINRMVSRNHWLNFPEKSYVCITRGIPDLRDEDFNRGKVYGKIFHRNSETLVKQAFIPDWFLIPKHDEKNYLSSLLPPEPAKINKYITIPPLLKLLMIREMEVMGQNADIEPKIKRVLGNKHRCTLIE
ncbi:small ribosomal subunit protein mS34-like isoform X2 [Gordionus sp. m RMFG-2023]|uniref:small ribosomal subunit protein mS34-like isoform X2 n=1 Tax=Gordionus sp. m RMFG-2023 TaxID=3053472 RepID=UPI0031FBF943